MTELREKLINISEEKQAKIIPENLKVGVEAFGVQGNFTSDANATASDIAKDKTAYVNGEKVVGTLEVGGNYNAMIEMPTSTTFTIASSFTEIDLTNFNTSNKTSFRSAFENCSNLRIIKGEIDCSNATNFYYMYKGCTNIQEIRLKNVLKPTNFDGICYGCSNLKSFIVNGIETTNISDYVSAFQGCSLLEDIPVLSFSAITAYYGLSNMFYGCPNLTDESLNNILAMCITGTRITSNKILSKLGITKEQATRCQSLSNYQAFLDAGWITGY